MSSNMDHRKPAVAFVLLAVVAAAVVGNSFRARAESLDHWLAGEAPSERAEGASPGLADRAQRATRADRNGDRAAPPLEVPPGGLTPVAARERTVPPTSGRPAGARGPAWALDSHPSDGRAVRARGGDEHKLQGRARAAEAHHHAAAGGHDRGPARD